MLPCICKGGVTIRYVCVYGCATGKGTRGCNTVAYVDDVRVIGETWEKTPYKRS